MSDEGISAFDPNRDRGILTEEDRKFLLGETEYENPQSARRSRARIRQRVTDALLDFEILRYLEVRDRDQIFQDQEPDLGGSFSQAYTFLYDGLLRYWDDYWHVDKNLNIYLEQAIQNTDFTQGYRTEFSMEIERDKLDDPEEIFQRAKEQGFQSLTWPEFEYIWKSNKVNAGEFAQFLSRLFGENIDGQNIRYERQKIQEWREDKG